MNLRLLGISLLVLMIIAGLVAGIFTDSIQRALTIPARAMPVIPIVKGNMPRATLTTATNTPANVIAQDMFQRPDQPLWGTATDTRTWTGDANNANEQNIFSISNKTGQITHGQGTFDALLGDATSNVEVLMQGSVNSFDGTVNLGAVLRWNDKNNWYKLLIDGTNVELLKRINGASTVLATQPFAAKSGKSYNLRFRALVAMLFATVWRSTFAEPAHWTLPVNDTHLTNGLPGVRVLVKNNTIVNVTSFVTTAANSGM